MKKTKIVCTIGPASQSEEMLKELMESGMNVARLNFSHGNHEEHKMRMDTIKKVRQELKKPVAIMLDTKGPEIRLGDLKEESYELIKGERLTLTPRDVVGTKDLISISYKELAGDLNVGGQVLIDDGLIGLEVLEIKENGDIVCEIKNQGIVKGHKGVNVPGAKISLPALTEKDESDILFGIEQGIDYIAASFVRKADDVRHIREILEKNNGRDIMILAKIENQEGAENAEAILEAADGIMVARGDLGVEIPTEEVPIVQKQIVRRCNEVGKPVIIATQMLDSMQRNPRPTRAEVTDVANAIIDGTDAIMLSGETAAGKYPVESVKTMVRIAKKTEGSDSFREAVSLRQDWHEKSTPQAISRVSCSLSRELNATAIVAPTTSGATALAISKYRPEAPVIAATSTERVQRKLALIWGVESVLCEESTETDMVLRSSIQATEEAGYIKTGERIVITAGIPSGVRGTTNMIKVHRVGNKI